MLPVCILSVLKYLYDLANDPNNNLQEFVRYARSNILVDLGDDFKWNILRKILQGEENHQRKREKYLLTGIFLEIVLGLLNVNIYFLFLRLCNIYMDYKNR